MARQHANESDEEFHSLSDYEVGVSDDPLHSSATDPPMHPVPSMQGPFEESILEATQDDEDLRSTIEKNAEERRRRLLDADQYDASWSTRWKQAPGAEHHPLLKLMAQIVFGMHLLQEEQAKSDEEVVKILQTHINDVDGFLERTSDDFDLAIRDIEERIRYLRLPMEHMDVFDMMLDDKRFRTELLNGNEKIEKIIDRTAKAMNAASHDVQAGIRATKELGTYLTNVEGEWSHSRRAIIDIFSAMRGNEQGWKKYLKDLQAKGNNLETNLTMLGNVIGDISRLAGEASRRHQPPVRNMSPASFRSAPGGASLRSKFAREPPSSPLRKPSASIDKPLPREPGVSTGARHATMPKMHPVPFETRFEQPRPSPTSARRTGTPAELQQPRKRPSTSHHVPRESRTAQTESTRELADFLRGPGGTDSRTPTQSVHRADRSEHGVRVGRSASHGAKDVLSAVENKETRAQVARTMSQGAITVISQPQKKEPSRQPMAESSARARDTSVEDSTTSRRKDSSSGGVTFGRRISRRLKSLTSSAEMTTPPAQSLTRPSTRENMKDPYVRDEQRPTRLGARERPVENRIHQIINPSRQHSKLNSPIRRKPVTSPHSPLPDVHQTQGLLEEQKSPPSDSAYASVAETSNNRSRGPSDSSAETGSDDQNVGKEPAVIEDTTIEGNQASNADSDTSRVLHDEHKSEVERRARNSSPHRHRSPQAHPKEEFPHRDHVSTDTEQMRTPRHSDFPKPPPIPAATADADMKARARSSSGLGLFPRESFALTPSQASLRNKHLEDPASSGSRAMSSAAPNYTLERTATASSLARSFTMPVSGPAPGNPRALSFRKFFHMKRESQGRNAIPAAGA